MFGHCIKQFSYFGKYIRSIGKCGRNTNGSLIDPLQFDRVTDIAQSSNGFCYVTDGDIGGLNNRVLVLNQSMDLIKVWGKHNKPGSEPLQFDLPHKTVVDVCNRVWIVDTLNHRIQIISGDGKFLGQWRCFGSSFIYGLDLAPKQAGYWDSSAVLTTKTATGPEILILSFKTKCDQLKNFGKCEIEKRMVPSWVSKPEQNSPASMMHSVTFDNGSKTMYVAELPGSTPPLKLNVAHLPPQNNFATCKYLPEPPVMPRKWSAKVLLTPFTNSDLVTGHVEYSSDLNAMYFRLFHPVEGVSELYVQGQQTYHLRMSRNTSVCTGPYHLGWIVPLREWMRSRPCKCQGSLVVSGIDTVFWRCPVFHFVDWFWFHRENKHLWRIMLNNNTNPLHLPVLGEYAMVHFTNHGDDVHNLEKSAKLCSNASRDMLNISVNSKNFVSFTFQTSAKHNDKMTPIRGFSYETCKLLKSLPQWPQHFYLTATMIPVDDKDPFPTQVLYDWSRRSQHTRMHTGNTVYESYLINHDTYILTRSTDGKINCTGHLKFGPPQPNWMNDDNCKCMGRIHDNPDFSPWRNTTIVVCPLVGTRVFWAWFSNDHNAYTPVMFYETDSPLQEGTNLALADYHFFHSDQLLTDLKQFQVPPECV